MQFKIHPAALLLALPILTLDFAPKAQAQTIAASAAPLAPIAETPSASSPDGGVTATITLTFANPNTPSVAAVVSGPISTTYTDSAGAAQTRTATLNVPGVNRRLLCPTVTILPLAATATTAGIGLPPAANLPVGVAIVNGAVVYSGAHNLDGGATFTVSIAGFPVLPPTSPVQVQVQSAAGG